MRQATFLSAVLLLSLAVSVVAAQDKKAKVLTAIGPVTAIAGDSLTVDTGKGSLVFVTTSTTQVKVTGGSAKERAAKAAGQKGVKVTEAVHQGDQVSVKYTDAGGKLMASEIDVKARRPSSALPVK